MHMGDSTVREDERRELSKGEDLLRDSYLHPDADVRKQAKVVLEKIIDHRRDHNTLPPASNIVPEGVESISRRVQKASEIHK